MKLKAVSRVVFALYMISIVLVFTTLHDSHFTRSVACSGFIALSFIYMLLRIKISRDKANANQSTQISGIQKVSNNIILAAGFGAMSGLTIIVWGMRSAGLPILNTSLMICIVGFIGLMAAPQKPNPVLNPNQMKVYSWVLCLCIICTLTGLLIRINHYPGGKQFEYGGIITLLGAIFSFIIYAKYKKVKLKQ